MSLVTSLLTGDVLNWASLLLEHNSSVLQDREAFLREFSILLDDPPTEPRWQRLSDEICSRERALLSYMAPFSAVTQWTFNGPKRYQF